MTVQKPKLIPCPECGELTPEVVIENQGKCECCYDSDPESQS